MAFFGYAEFVQWYMTQNHGAGYFQLKFQQSIPIMLSPFPAVAKVSTNAVDPAVAVVQALVQKTKRLANYLTGNLFWLPDYQTIDVKTTDRTSIKISGRKSTKTFQAKIRKLFICQSQQRGP